MCIGLQKTGHLIDKRTGAACADTVHTLFDVAVFKINDLGIFTAQLDRHIGLRLEHTQCRRYGDYLLNKRNVQIFGDRKTAGTRDHRVDLHLAETVMRLVHQVEESLTDVGEVPFVVGKQHVVGFI